MGQAGRQTLAEKPGGPDQDGRPLDRGSIMGRVRSCRLDEGLQAGRLVLAQLLSPCVRLPGLGPQATRGEQGLHSQWSLVARETACAGSMGSTGDSAGQVSGDRKAARRHWFCPSWGKGPVGPDFAFKLRG